MKIKTIKTRTVHPMTVRKFLESKGFMVGSWHASGRISGMSNFSGGNLEIKENQKTMPKLKTEDLGNGFFRREWHLETNVIVRSFGLVNGKEADINKVAESLKDGGFSVSLQGKEIIVDK